MTLEPDADWRTTLLQREPGAAILDAVMRLLKNDEYLMAIDANERSIAHHFAKYLELAFPDWQVDCEYNRDGVDPKRIGYLNIQVDEEDTEAKTVYPDIVVHQRGKRSNYLVIEMKKSTSAVDRGVDLQKLVGYMRDLNYQFALYVEFLAGTEGGGIKEVRWIDG